MILKLFYNFLDKDKQDLYITIIQNNLVKDHYDLNLYYK